MFFVKFIYKGESPILATDYNGDLIEFPTFEMANQYGQKERNAIFRAIAKTTHTTEQLQKLVKNYVPKYEVIFRTIWAYHLTTTKKCDII